MRRSIVQSHLNMNIKNLSRSISAFAFIEGFLDAKHLIFYLIYNQVLKVPLLIYSITNSLIIFAMVLRIFYGVISDNVKICGSKRKSYIILLSAIEVILYILSVLVIELDLNIGILIASHFILKIANTWRHGILCKLTSGFDCFFEGIELSQKRCDQLNR